MFTTRLVESEEDLERILALQASQLGSRLAPEQAVREGFLTVVHDLPTLARMHALSPSVIVTSGSTLAGYALVMPLEAAPWVPVLEPLFELLGTLAFRGAPLASLRHYVMGQICVAPAFRGQGVFDALYAGHRAHLAPRYDAVVTEIATRNGRSMRAHARVGFEHLHTHRDATDEWAVVGWDLRVSRGAR